MKIKLPVAMLGMLFAVPVLAMDTEVSSQHEDIQIVPASERTLTGNISLVSDYLDRGISQTGHKPAVQGGFDYAPSSGFYAGIWASNISWITDSNPAISTSANIDLETYFGFKNSFATDYSYDIGFLRFNYPGNYVPGAIKPDTNEIYAGISYKLLTAKYTYNPGNTFGVPDAKGTNYIELGVSYTMPDNGITLGAHLGRQSYKGSSAAYNAAIASGSPNYTDYSLSASRALSESGYVLGFLYSMTNAVTKGFYASGQGMELGSGTFVLSISRTF